jgi:RNA-directed DNA polymerase
MTPLRAKALWGARCGKSARRVLTGGTSPRSHAGSVRSPVRKRRLRQGSAKATASRLVSTGHSIPHAELMRSVARRVSDRHLLHLIKMWLDAPVEEDDGQGGKKRTTPNKDSGRGVPQGAPISPLLSNLYMRRFILGWRQRGFESRLRAKIVSYADDYVICCKGSADEALVAMRTMMAKLKLTINEAKTRVCQLPNERFDFLGYDFGRCYSIKTGRAYFGTRPSKKSLSKIIGAIRECTDGRTTWQEAEDLVSKLNRKLVGWSNYFSLGPVSHAYRAIDQYTTRRLRRWLRKKHKVRNTGKLRFTQEYMHEQLDLCSWPRVRKTFRGRKLDVLSESRMR